MKRLFLTILSIVFYTICCGQQCTLKQLLNMYDLDKDKFDTYVTEKGYSSFKTENGVNYARAIYAFNMKNDFTSNYISMFYYNSDGLKLLQYNTTNKNYCLSIKKELEALRFEYSPDNTSDPDMQSFTYSKGKTTVVIVVKQGKTNSDELFNSYEIGVIKLK